MNKKEIAQGQMPGGLTDDALDAVGATWTHLQKVLERFDAKRSFRLLRLLGSFIHAYVCIIYIIYIYI